MAREIAKHHPGSNDISDQFSPAYIQKALNDFKQISRGGDYTFGDLTAKFYNLNPTELGHWKSDVALYPKDVQNEIKRHIIYALTRKDDHGHERPVPLSIKWRAPTGAKSIRCTYDPSGPSYAIVISGFPSPLSTRFADRREKY